MLEIFTSTWGVRKHPWKLHDVIVKTLIVVVYIFSDIHLYMRAQKKGSRFLPLQTLLVSPPCHLHLFPTSGANIYPEREMREMPERRDGLSRYHGDAGN